jgi:hypothetical protein
MSTALKSGYKLTEVGAIPEEWNWCQFFFLGENRTDTDFFSVATRRFVENSVRSASRIILACLWSAVLHPTTVESIEPASRPTRAAPGCTRLL